MNQYAEQIAKELSLDAKNVQGAIDLIDAGKHHPVHRPLPQGGHRLDGRPGPAHAGRPA